MASSNGIQAFYSTNGSDWTEFPVPCVSIDPTPGSTTDINRGHLNATDALHTTSAGARQTGTHAFHFEWDSRLGATTGKGMDFLQLIHGWWKDRTGGDGSGLYFKVEWPKPSAATNKPKSVFQGYVNQEPIPSSPEDDRMMVDLQVKRTSDITNTDHS